MGSRLEWLAMSLMVDLEIGVVNLELTAVIVLKEQSTKLKKLTLKSSCLHVFKTHNNQFRDKSDSANCS